MGPYAKYPKINKTLKTEKIIFYPSRFIKYKRQELAINKNSLEEAKKMNDEKKTEEISTQIKNAISVLHPCLFQLYLEN